MKFFILLALLALFVFEQSTAQLSFYQCSYNNGQVIETGYPTRPMTAAEKQQMVVYEKQWDQWRVQVALAFTNVRTIRLQFDLFMKGAAKMPSVPVVPCFCRKVVIVTGSSNGIGRGTAIFFAKAGAKVTITGRNAATLAVTKQLCLSAGAKDSEILELIGDVTDDSFLERLVSTTVEKFGRIDVLVNNAGGVSFANYGKMITDYPIAELDEMFAINVKPVLRLSQLAAPHLEKTKGAIVNVSGALHKQLSPMPCMAAAKGALDQITIQMAGSLIKKGIRVNSVNPGVVATNFAVAAGAPKEMMEQMMAAMAANPVIPLGRVECPMISERKMSFFAGKVVIFTGSSKGIGRDTAALFAKQGAKVTGRSATSLEETKQQLLKAGAKEEDILEVHS
ncbi:hypothetical protein PRIPAC_80815 [Pristionchus pacificus]|uniref:Dehydrogenase n=1 Tax=Pristionchus pacificus TaxID=54126 RepID=A0A2A6C260_PRIPA|nr:hypothetical protein PRIPAC_80815 [Pristionchus pacificus]|eukprot:PDM72113.1 dehydrogenase [Pristionchus pacificus]